MEVTNATTPPNDFPAFRSTQKVDYFSRQSLSFTEPTVTPWVKVVDSVLAGLGGSATAVDAVLEISIPTAAGEPDTALILADVNGEVGSVNVSEGNTIDVYDLPGPVFARWNITTITGGDCRPFITGKGW